MNFRFGGFIITYNRPEILKITIEKIFSQSVPPQILWVIDNSEGNETAEMVERMNNIRVFYHRMGFNSGPAGAAGIGLEFCGNEGLDWIYWGDDNDPPFRQDCYERLLELGNGIPSCGVIGTVGHFFDRENGVLKRIETTVLEKSKSIEVDYVAGGMCMLVRGEVARNGIKPNPDLFFGFEELDFCLKAKNEGFKIVIDCSLNIEARRLSNRLVYKQPTYKRKRNLSREYYSLRNLLIIGNTLSLNYMKWIIYLRWFAKSIFGFRYGLNYGFENFKMIILAFYHYFINKNGKQIDL
ncbi:glycosyltransferase [Algoriphagus persicinus]|uniref:glycosyltransferase n=1 Tax=Algoriphagus persicinus TaxID=3108754 RepID=UPI002B3739C8|nr:glycosyltransferase [Algoriphagus sp. E1-3-M2]MEB2784732.1 glycosyltransferase [Algoriphagus sp. E1-3-M2]